MVFMSLGANEWGAQAWAMEVVELGGIKYLRLNPHRSAIKCYHITLVEDGVDCPQYEGVPTRMHPPMRMPLEARNLGLVWEIVEEPEPESLLRFSLARGIYMGDQHYKWLCQMRGAIPAHAKGRQATKYQTIKALVENVFTRPSDTSSFKSRIILRLLNARQMGQRAKKKIDVLTVAAAEEMDPENKQDFEDILKIVRVPKHAAMRRIYVRDRRRPCVDN
jgi:hypothetical protein